MKQAYETMIVFDGALPEDTVIKEREKIQVFLKENSDFEKVDDWGKRELAYAIGKKRVGHYSLFIYKSEGAVPGRLDKILRGSEPVLRFLTVQQNLKVRKKQELAAQPVPAEAI